MSVLVSNALVVIFLQWANPFDGSANTADYDLLLVDAAGNTLAISNDDQLKTTGSAAGSHRVYQYDGPGDDGRCGGQSCGRTSPALLTEFNTFGRVTVLKHNVTSGSVFGHPCVRDVVAVGAVDVQ